MFISLRSVKNGEGDEDGRRSRGGKRVWSNGVFSERCPEGLGGVVGISDKSGVDGVLGVFYIQSNNGNGPRKCRSNRRFSSGKGTGFVGMSNKRVEVGMGI